jgi:hypothetical protein
MPARSLEKVGVQLILHLNHHEVEAREHIIDVVRDLSFVS